MDRINRKAWTTGVQADNESEREDERALQRSQAIRLTQDARGRGAQSRNSNTSTRIGLRGNHTIQ
jgi:hypothetical protein